MPQYTSQYAGLCMIVRKEIMQRYPDGTAEMIKPPLEVNFGRWGAAHQLMEGEGEGAVPIRAREADGLPGPAYQMIDFQGGFIDTDVMIREMRDAGLWDDEDVETVLRRLEEACNNPNSPFHGMVSRYEMPTPNPPWPTYDSMPDEQVAEMALNAGMVVQALIYEKDTKARPDVVADLEKALERQQGMAELEATPAF